MNRFIHVIIFAFLFSSFCGYSQFHIDNDPFETFDGLKHNLKGNIKSIKKESYFVVEKKRRLDKRQIIHFSYVNNTLRIDSFFSTSFLDTAKHLKIVIHYNSDQNIDSAIVFDSTSIISKKKYFYNPKTKRLDSITLNGNGFLANSYFQYIGKDTVERITIRKYFSDTSTYNINSTPHLLGTKSNESNTDILIDHASQIKILKSKNGHEIKRNEGTFNEAGDIIKHKFFGRGKLIIETTFKNYYDDQGNLIKTKSKTKSPGGKSKAYSKIEIEYI